MPCPEVFMAFTGHGQYPCTIESASDEPAKDMKTPMKVTPDDHPEQVMAKILAVLAQSGETHVGELIEGMHLYENEISEQTLQELYEREMIEAGGKGDTIRITDYGHKMAEVLREALGG